MIEDPSEGQRSPRARCCFSARAPAYTRARFTMSRIPVPGFSRKVSKLSLWNSHCLLTISDRLACRLVWRQDDFFGAALRADRPCRPRTAEAARATRSKHRPRFPANGENNRENARFSVLPCAEKPEKRRCHRGLLQSHWTNLTGKFETVFREDILQNRESDALAELLRSVEAAGATHERR